VGVDFSAEREGSASVPLYGLLRPGGIAAGIKELTLVNKIVLDLYQDSGNGCIVDRCF